MEIPRTAHPNGLMFKVDEGTPVAISLDEYAGRYVKIVSPDDDFFFNVVAEDPGETPALDSTTEVLVDGDDVADYAAKKSGEGFTVPRAPCWLVVDPATASATDVRVFVKPTSSPNQPPVR